MRSAIPWMGAAVVLVALMPAVCGSAEDGETACQSALLLPLPWGESADTWGWFVAIGCGLATYIALRLLLRRR